MTSGFHLPLYTSLTIYTSRVFFTIHLISPHRVSLTMSMPTGPLQFHYKEQRFWGIETRHYVVLDTWLEYNRLPYFQFYTSFINWCIKLATNYNKTGGKKLKPREADVRAALHGEHFRNPFQLIRILETFRATVYRGQPMKGWIKDHTGTSKCWGPPGRHIPIARS